MEDLIDNFRQFLSEDICCDIRTQLQNIQYAPCETLTIVGITKNMIDLPYLICFFIRMIDPEIYIFNPCTDRKLFELTSHLSTDSIPSIYYKALIITVLYNYLYQDGELLWHKNAILTRYVKHIECKDNKKCLEHCWEICHHPKSEISMEIRICVNDRIFCSQDSQMKRIEGDLMYLDEDAPIHWEDYLNKHSTEDISRITTSEIVNLLIEHVSNPSMDHKL